ncbi:hypothetical protein IAD21_04818 [Abditibacteriota bacterium]|nr:hypothetical protein IAD21_04818 [Abditibacteriota bacterium]
MGYSLSIFSVSTLSTHGHIWLCRPHPIENENRGNRVTSCDSAIGNVAQEFAANRISHKKLPFLKFLEKVCLSSGFNGYNHIAYTDVQISQGWLNEKKCFDSTSVKSHPTV